MSLLNEKVVGRFYKNVKPRYRYAKMKADMGEYKIVYDMTLPNKRGLIKLALSHFKIDESDLGDGFYDAPDRMRKRVLRELLSQGWIDETRRRMCKRYDCTVRLFTYHVSRLRIRRVDQGLFVEIVVVGQYAKQ